MENLIFLTVHYRYPNSYSNVLHLFAKIWYGHGRTGRAASDDLDGKVPSTKSTKNKTEL